ncbi:hypothetical protein ABEW34_08075 [Paenibacillus algorifonticola]|uniref:hypothetical protein n=1 Tax=Paenibacillus algorifonticola TaxID=684063 RepID=UPI003D28D8C6
MVGNDRLKRSKEREATSFRPKQVLTDNKVSYTFVYITILYTIVYKKPKGEIEMRDGHRYKDKRGHGEHGEHRGHGHHHKHGVQAQTFRRGRALAFLESLNVKRSTLQRQLDEPEFESIKQVISGELKATDTIIQEFIHVFQLYDLTNDSPITEEKSSGDNIVNDNVGDDQSNP